MQLLAILFFCGLSAAVVGKLKGSSLILWFLVGFCLPFLGTVAALAWRSDHGRLRRPCQACGAMVPLHDQICMRCGSELDFAGRASAAGEPLRSASSPP